MTKKYFNLYTDLSATQYEQYQKSLIQYWDVKNVTDTAFKDGIEKGEKIGIEKGERIGIEKGELAKAIKIAKEMLAENLPLTLIVKLTGLSEREIEKL